MHVNVAIFYWYSFGLTLHTIIKLQWQYLCSCHSSYEMLPVAVWSQMLHSANEALRPFSYNSHACEVMAWGLISVWLTRMTQKCQIASDPAAPSPIGGCFCVSECVCHQGRLQLPDAMASMNDFNLAEGENGLSYYYDSPSILCINAVLWQTA